MLKELFSLLFYFFLRDCTQQWVFFLKFGYVSIISITLHYLFFLYVYHFVGVFQWYNYLVFWFWILLCFDIFILFLIFSLLFCVFIFSASSVSMVKSICCYSKHLNWLFSASVSVSSAWRIFELLFLFLQLSKGCLYFAAGLIVPFCLLLFTLVLLFLKTFYSLVWECRFCYLMTVFYHLTYLWYCYLFL